ncbi:hypothetical protein Fmac_003276 [Flemingia macrophylla]|uniref:Uncharacterized protein n=1 Tax=Flemingia macrophylla TaxID=520843 RepID=A0ABD1NMZ6_9FABA
MPYASSRTTPEPWSLPAPLVPTPNPSPSMSLSEPVIVLKGLVKPVASEPQGRDSNDSEGERRKERLCLMRPAAPDYISLNGGSKYGIVEGLSDEELEFHAQIAMFGEKVEGRSKGVFEEVEEICIPCKRVKGLSEHIKLDQKQCQQAVGAMDGKKIQETLHVLLTKQRYHSGALCEVSTVSPPTQQLTATWATGFAV